MNGVVEWINGRERGLSKAQAAASILRNDYIY